MDRWPSVDYLVAQACAQALKAKKQPLAALSPAQQQDALLKLRRNVAAASGKGVDFTQ